MAVSRNGFKMGNLPGNSAMKGGGKGDLSSTEFADHIMGDNDANVVNGAGGSDVIIGFGGDDLLAGGAGHDDISGGTGNDTLLGGSWTDDGSLTVEFAEVAGDAEQDVYVAGSSFADNGTDTILGYQSTDVEGGVAGDVIDLGSALNGVYAVALTDAVGDTQVAWDALVAGGYVSYADGTLSLDLDGTAGEADASNPWFVVKSAGEGDWANAASIVVVVGGTEFTMEGAVTV